MKKFLAKSSLLALIAALSLICACGTNDADSSVSDSSIPDSPASESTVPDSSEPDSSIPDSSEPDSSEPDSSVPETCEHSGGKATCSEAAVCEKCGESYGETLAHAYETTVITPTCTEGGYTVYTCGDCGHSYKGNIKSANGHHYVGVDTYPTCTEGGFSTYTCDACGNSFVRDEVDPVGHIYAAVVTEPTCESDGYTTYTCETCGDSYTSDVVAAFGHSFVDGKCECGADFVLPEEGPWTLVTQLNDGDKVLIGAPAYGKLLSAEKVSAGSYYNKGVNYTVEDFGAVTDAEIFVVTVNADNSYTFTSLTGDVIALASSYSSLNVTGQHKSWSLEEKGDGLFLVKNIGRGNYLEWYSSKNNWSTYTKPTTNEYELSFYAKQESAEDHVHNYISEVHAATCTEDGYTSYTCRCGDKYVVEEGEAATGHNHVATVVAPTCTEDGYTSHDCVCGDSYITDEIPATGHNYVATVVAPTCTEDGYTSHDCACGDNYITDEIPATGHNFVDGKCECGEVEQTGPVVTTGSADFSTITLPSNKPNGDSSYTSTYTTANGWVSKNSAIQCGGTSNSNPQFTVIGSDNTYKAVCLNGKTSATGSLTSPTLNGGLSTLTVKYTKMFTDTKLSATITVTELSSGNVYTHTISVTLPKDEKFVIYTDEWVLDTPVIGDFTIEIKNNCPSNSSNNKDRMTILSVDWVGAVATHTHEYTSTTTATCTAAGTTTYTCACGDTYTEETGILDHVDKNLDITCDFEGCTKRILPAGDTKVSLFTANHMIIVSLNNNYYVEGVITEITDAKNGMFIIEDEAGDTIFIRMPKDENGNAYSAWKNCKVVVGDTVQVYGKPTKNTGAPTTQKAKVEGGVLTILKHEHTFSAPTCTEAATCPCLAVSDPALGHINEDGDNLCDRCSWNLNLQISNIVISTDTTLSNGVLDAAKTSWTWSDDNFNAIIAKGTSTVTLYTTAKAYMQLKKLNTFTLENKNDKTIKTVTILTTNATQLTNLEKALANNNLTFTKDADALTITIEWNSTNDLTFTNNGTTTAYISGVEIVYE